GLTCQWISTYWKLSGSAGPGSPAFVPSPGRPRLPVGASRGRGGGGQGGGSGGGGAGVGDAGGPPTGRRREPRWRSSRGCAGEGGRDVAVHEENRAAVRNEGRLLGG